MANFIRSSKQNPCPICNRTKDGDCRATDNGEVVMCHSIQDGIGAYDESKWHYNGQLYIWGQFILKTVKSDKFVKPGKPRSSRDYFYPYTNGNPLVRVTRKDDGMGGKTFSQSHWNGKKWVNGNPAHIRSLISIYRVREVWEAIRNEEQIFIVEGEVTADALWELGIPATTTIGGSGGYKRYGNYTEQLDNARLVLCPDRDANGLKYIANFVRDFPSQIDGYYLAGTASLWKNPQGGMDIANDLSDRGYSKQDLIDRIITTSKFDEIFTTNEITEEAETERPKFTTSIGDGLKREAMELLPDGSFKRVRKLIGNHIEAIAYVENIDGGGTGIFIEFFTQRGKLDRALIPRATLNGDGADALKLLVDRGYHYQRHQKQKLLDYLFELGTNVAQVYSIADRTGWIDGSFLTPSKTYGDPNLRFREPEPDNSLVEVKGTIDEWKAHIAAKCERNSRLIFALGTVFAAPLLNPCQIESGGFHLVGTTSIGKTTTLKIVSGMAGLKNIPNWRSTSNALEGKASEFNHSLLPLDEIIQADPQSVGASAYMLGNGQGKSRMAKTLTTIKPKTWELLFLSTGEVSMTDYLRQAKITVNGGMEARMPSIPADAGKGFGAFECLHGFVSAKEFVTQLEDDIRKYQGTALDEYLTQLTIARQSPDFDKQLRERVHSIARSLSEKFSDSAIGRVAVRFALVQVGLEVAHSFNILPFPITQCSWSVAEMFGSWTNARGGDGSIEIKEACNKIELLFESAQHGDRIYDVGKDLSGQVRNLLAYRVFDTLTQTIEFLVPVPIFNAELADGVDRHQLITELQKRGYLKVSTESDRNTVKRVILGKRRSFFAFHEFWTELEKNKFPHPHENATGHTGHTGRAPETSSDSASVVSRTLRDSENTNGTHGTSPWHSASDIDLESGVCPVCPVEENSAGQSRDTSESSAEAGLRAAVPCVPCVPLEKQHPEMAAKIDRDFKVSDLVKYVGNHPQILNQCAGTLTVYEIGNLGDSCSCLKLDGSVSSWIDFCDLELVATYHRIAPDFDFWQNDEGIHRVALSFEKNKIAKEWKKAIEDMFGFAGVLAKIQRTEYGYNWQLSFDKFSHRAIDVLDTKRLWLSPDGQGE